MTYTGDSPVTEVSRTVTTSAYGPIINDGENCGGRVCTLDIQLALSPGWSDWTNWMRSHGYSVGRISIASQCPGDAHEAHTTFNVFYASSDRVRSSIWLSCDYTQYYTVPSRNVPWTFEWKDAESGEWVNGGGQAGAADQVRNAYPGVSVDPYQDALLSAVSAGTVCDRLLFVPDPSPRLTSVPRQYQLCAALLAASSTMTAKAAYDYVTQGLLAEFGYGLLDYLVAHDDTVAPPRTEPLPTQDPNPQPTLPVPLPPEWSDPITNAWSDGQPEPEASSSVAMRCRQLVAIAGVASIAGAGKVPRHPCEILPIFSPGSDVPSAATHKERSILSASASVLLHNQTGAATDARLLGQGYIENPWDNWRQQVPASSAAYASGGTPCGQTYDTAQFQCDEYPYYASVEGGPWGPPGDPGQWWGFTLDLIPASENSLEGTRFGAFKSDPKCGLVDPETGSQVQGVPFLVIPMSHGPATQHICGSRP